MNSELTVTGIALEIRSFKRQLIVWILKFESVSLLCFGHLKHCFENFPASAYELLLKYDRPYFDIHYGGTVGLCWNENYNTTHTYKYLLTSKLYSLTSEVAAYLPLFYRLLLSGVDCGVELRCNTLTRPRAMMNR